MLQHYSMPYWQSGITFREHLIARDVSLLEPSDIATTAAQEALAT